MTIKITPFDVAEYMDDEETINAYFSQVLADGDTDEIIQAINDVARARGMSQVSAASGLGRESLYKALSPGAKPRFDTILRVIRALGIRLRAA